MADILGVPVLGSGFSLGPPPEHPKPAVTEVAALSKGENAMSHLGNDTLGQNDKATLKRDQRQTQDRDGVYAPKSERATIEGSEHLDPDMLTGPTPAFQASIIEVESDLRNVIARVEAKRAQQSEERALSLSSETQLHQDQTLEATADMRRDLSGREASVEAPKTEPQAAESPIATPSPTPLVQTEAQDREANYAGRAATPETPYTKPTVTE